MTDKQSVIVVEYQDLLDKKDLTAQIAAAYGFDGLGLLAVRGVPGFAEKREKLLPFALKFASLPDEVKAKYEHPQSYYSFGWSHGKEKFNGTADLAKGSYYANPQFDKPVHDQAIIDQHIAFVHPNIWPDEDIHGFSHAFKECGQLMIQVGELVAIQCDAYVISKCPTYHSLRLTRTIRESVCCKGRLLHYFDLPEKKEQCKPDSWCGWHNDHGSLTALCPGMYFDKSGNQIQVSDPHAGLFVHTRTGKTVQASIPSDCIGFQIGETAQIHSGGVLQATPHCVMGGDATGVTRESFAVFMEPNWDDVMDVPENVDPSQAFMGSKKDLLPSGVPLLEARWVPNDSFAGFSEKTFKSYYDY